MSTATKVQTHTSTCSNVVNGIDTDAVHALIDDVDSDPAKGMTHWRVASAWQGGTHSRAQVDGFAIGGVNVPRRFAIDMDEQVWTYLVPGNTMKLQPGMSAMRGSTSPASSI